MSYQVIARKYRPRKFSEITAQEHITHTIQNALRLGRVGHGYIFSGLRGVGKTTAARIFAKAVNCHRMIEDEAYRQEVTEPCGECESCRDFEAGTSLNISEFDAASNNSVDDIRQLRENVRYGPQKGRYRVYIIDEVHMLSTAAFNAFLKTLEEPPAHAIFIFATTELHKIPATISSRCQRFNFKRIPLALIQSQLQQICRQEQIDISDDALLLIGRKAQGSMRDAQSILDQVIAFSIGENHEEGISYQRVADLLNYVDDEHFFAVTDAMAENDPAAMLQVARYVIDNGYDELDFLEKLIEHFRNFLILYNLRSARLIERTDAIKKRYQESAGHFTAPLVMECMDRLLQASKELKFQFEYQFRFELILLQLIEVVHPRTQGGQSGKKKAPEQPVSGKRPADPPQPPADALRVPSQPSPPRQTVPPPVPQQNPESSSAPSVSRSPASTSGHPERTPGVNFSSWQDKLVNFSRKSAHPPVKASSSSAGASHPPAAAVAEVEKFRLEWNQFLESLLDKKYKILVTHLRSCELTSCHDGELVLSCSRKFSYEELTQDADMLADELRSFYGISIRLSICYDEGKDSSTREQTVFTLFRELAESNDVVRYLIREFGGELVY
ncbi:MAG: DNA polymerase III subunit gamma/tau [Prosthecochloris sp.]|nr:DNA polymerase III subunit gamma/tau [Prosthecochloris sp.]